MPENLIFSSVGVVYCHLSASPSLEVVLQSSFHMLDPQNSTPERDPCAEVHPLKFPEAHK